MQGVKVELDLLAVCIVVVKSTITFTGKKNKIDAKKMVKLTGDLDCSLVDEKLIAQIASQGRRGLPFL